MLEPLKLRSDLCSSWPMTEPINVERHEGQVASRGATGYWRGETSESGKPKGATGMKQGWTGDGRSKASRGRESPRTPRSRGRQPRYKSLPASACAEGQETPWETAVFRTHAGQTPATEVRGALGMAKRPDDVRTAHERSRGPSGVRVECSLWREPTGEARPSLVTKPEVSSARQSGEGGDFLFGAPHRSRPEGFEASCVVTASSPRG